MSWAFQFPFILSFIVIANSKREKLREGRKEGRRKVREEFQKPKASSLNGECISCCVNGKKMHACVKED